MMVVRLRSWFVLVMFQAVVFRRNSAAFSVCCLRNVVTTKPTMAATKALYSSSSSTTSTIPGISGDGDGDGERNHESRSTGDSLPPWNDPRLAERAQAPTGLRSRQHVNPLASKFQQPTILPDNWPNDVYDDVNRPLFLDIGCSRGGFLVDMATKFPEDYNYLGLEIRPIVVYHAKSRIEKHKLTGRLDFVGCNANVDLERILRRVSDAYSGSHAESNGNLQMVAIQFPDPHFKARHAKRRVVTRELIHTLAKFMPAGATVFLQSDVQPVLDEMRSTFREYGLGLFVDSLESTDEYVPTNIMGVPTERETSVLERDLPVYRAVFTRTDQQNDVQEEM